MSEWWTYSLSSFLLFSPRTYYRLFELYNAAIWPMQVVGLALGAAVLLLLLRPVAAPGRLIAAILALCWAWIAWFYLITHYDTINWAASYLAYGFAAQALLLVLSCDVLERLSFRRWPDPAAVAGTSLAVFALAIYPLIGPLVLGRPWTQAELFGVTPDPTVIATLGVLVAARRAHWLLLGLPLVWCLIAGATLWTMESPDWFVLPVAGAIALVTTVWKSLARGAPDPLP
jgi:hypothetical protein